MESDVMDTQQDEAWKQELIRRKKNLDEAKVSLDDALKRAVVDGRSYTLLGSLLGQSNAAVRLKARRAGWDTDRRKPRVRG
jgi:hypothetical protein